MRLLAILWGSPPTSEDWKRLSAARLMTGYTELIQPAEALPGSPQPVLAVGSRPKWITDYTFVEDTLDLVHLSQALSYCLEGPHEPPGEDIAKLISSWMSANVSFVGEEEYVEPELG